MSFRQIQAAAAVMYLLSDDDEKKYRSCWVRDWIQKREKVGFYRKLLVELKTEDAAAYKNFLRMSH